MREIGVGVRIGVAEGMKSTGIEEVNALINLGARVTAIEPVGAIMRRVGEPGEDGDEKLTLSGCEIKVIIDDSGLEASPTYVEHQKLYEAGSELISPYMELTDRSTQSASGSDAIESINRGIELLRRAIEINPANWSAYWIIGKAYQAMNDSKNACEAFKRSFAIRKGHVDVAREYMIECLKVGDTEHALTAAQHAVAVEPENAELIANLALAQLISGDLDDASKSVDKCLSMTPDDQVAHNIGRMIAEVQAGRRAQPTCLGDLGAP